MSKEGLLIDKKMLCKNMAENLSTLRAKAGLSQTELANKLGFTRQTITAIENGKREMQWSTFVALTLFFKQNEETQLLMTVLGIYTEDARNSIKL